MLLSSVPDYPGCSICRKKEAAAEVLCVRMDSSDLLTHSGGLHAVYLMSEQMIECHCTVCAEFQWQELHPHLVCVLCECVAADYPVSEWRDQWYSQSCNGVTQLVCTSCMHCPWS